VAAYAHTNAHAFNSTARERARNKEKQTERSILGGGRVADAVAMAAALGSQPG